jgi:hypothetical protein
MIAMMSARAALPDLRSAAKCQWLAVKLLQCLQGRREVVEMTNVHDVASYIVEKQGEMTAMKLQKLAYYSQAWHLVWDSEPLYPERIEAWMNGPVVAELYRAHRGRFHVEDWRLGDSSNLTKDEA